MMTDFFLSPKLWAVCGTAFLLLFPFFIPAGAEQFVLHLATLILLWTMLCVSLNVIFGYAGQLSLAQGGMFGTGAYVAGILAGQYGINFWWAFLAGGCASGLLGLIIGIPSLRLRGPYFVIVTMGFNIILVAIVENLGGLTGGVTGLMGIPAPSNIGNISFNSKIKLYYLILILLFIFWIVAYRIKNSRMGICLNAIKHDEDLCRSVGINTMWMKVQTFIVSSILAGLGGALYGSFLGIITPRDASFHIGFDALVFLIVGGIGTIPGTIIGPTIMVVISELTQSVVQIGILVNGLVLILLLIFMPKGLAGVFEHTKKIILLHSFKKNR
jgi:ABC-type branched-chain amino acid transport system, permease component